MSVLMHLCLASQQHLVIVRMAYPQSKFSWSYINAFLQFPTLAGKSPKSNILVVTWELVICLKYTHLHLGCCSCIHGCIPCACDHMSGISLVLMLQLLHKELFMGG